jgi:chromosome segregation ATPase
VIWRKELEHTIDSRIRNIEKEFYRMQGRKLALKKEITSHRDRKDKLKRKVRFANDCVQVFQLLAELKKKQVKKKIEGLVTKGLRTIFERNDYRFEIQMEQKRGVMSAKPLLYSRFGKEEFPTDIMEGHGGGLVNVVSFILQVIVLLSIRPPLERIMIVDEPFENVSKEYLSNVAEFLRYLSDLTGMQFIMITHKPEFLDVANKKFEVRLNRKQESIIKELK